MKKTADELLEEAKKMIGKETEQMRCKYPIEYEPLRRYCHMVDDENPLFFDPEYAKNTKYGSVIMPPFALMMYLGHSSMWPSKEVVSLIMPPTPGSNYINMAQEWELLKPIHVGDHITFKTRLADVYMKSISIDPKAFWVVNELTFKNQSGEVVAIIRNRILVHRSPEEVKQDNS